MQDNNINKNANAEKKHKKRRYKNYKNKKPKTQAAQGEKQNVASDSNLSKVNNIKNTNQNAKKPAQNKKPKTTVPAAKQSSDDIGLRLITRRAPAQKYASFEEYMKSRVSAEK